MALPNDRPMPNDHPMTAQLPLNDAQWPPNDLLVTLLLTNKQKTLLKMDFHWYFSISIYDEILKVYKNIIILKSDYFACCIMHVNK